MLLATTATAAQPTKESIFLYYWQDSSGHIVRTRFGGCWHTSLWEPGMAECPAAAEPLVIEDKPKVVKVVVEETDFFDFDKAVLKPEAILKLGRLVDLVESPAQFSNIRVFGYTDRIGTDDYNMALSKRRAEAVRDFLVSQDHIAADKIEVTAMGKKNPRVTCQGVHGNQQLISCLGHNRRVEVFLTFEKTERGN